MSGTSPRPRVRMPRKQRRAQLLAAAQDLFVEQGYHATVMDQIAERAGVSKPVLYQHFPGKLELYLAILDLHNAQLVRSVAQAAADQADNKNKVSAAVDAYFSFVEADGAAFRLVFESDLTNDPLVRDRVMSAERELARIVADIICEATDLPRAHAELLGFALSAMAHTSARAWLTSQNSISRDEAGSLIKQLAWRGIRAFPPSGEPGGRGGEDSAPEPGTVTGCGEEESWPSGIA